MDECAKLASQASLGLDDDKVKIVLAPASEFAQDHVGVAARVWDISQDRQPAFFARVVND